jgi:ribose transport system permease protein
VRSITSRIVRLEAYALLIIWLLVVILFSILEPEAFANWENFKTIFSSQTVPLMLTLALVVGLSAGEFDLSVGAVMAFTQTLTAYLTTAHGWGILPVIVAMLATGLAVGALNSFLVVRVGVQSIVVTLGMSAVLLGLSIGIASPEARPVTAQGFIDLVNHKWLGLPLAWYMALALTFGVYYLMEQTPLGRYIRFVGGSPEIARLNGVRVDAVRTFALIASALIAASAGVLVAGLQAASDVNSGTTILLPAFAGAFLGATAILPGYFNAWGSFIAVYFVVTGTTGLQLVGFAGWVEEMFYGIALIVAVAAAQLVARTVRPRRRAGDAEDAGPDPSDGGDDDVAGTPAPRLASRDA